MVKGQVRQGDILLQPAPKPAKAELKKKGQVTLAYGENTGHSHRLQQAALLQAQEQTYAELAEPTKLTHEEHGQISTSPGTYKVIRQREYTPGAVRNIAD